MSVFRKNIIVSYASQVVVVFCNFLCSILAARMLGANGQGDLALYTTFVAFITLIVGLGLPSAVVYFVASKKIKKEKVIPLLTSVTVVLIALFTMCLFLLREMNSASIFLPDFILEHPMWCCFLIIHLIVLMINQYFTSLLQAENNFIGSGAISAIGSVLLLLMYALKYFKYVALGIEPIYWILSSLFVVAGIQYFVFFVKIYKIDKSYFSFQSFTFLEFRPLLAFATVAYIANIIQFLNYRMDLWFINYFHHNKAMIGVYALAATLAQIVWHLPNAIHSVLYTYASSNHELGAKIVKTLKSANGLLLYGFIAGVLGYFLSLWLVPLWFGDEFADVPQLIGILLLGIVPFCYGIAISALFAGIQKVQINMYASVIGLLFCVGFDLLLIPSYGIIGAACASAISYTASALYLFYKFRKMNIVGKKT